MQQDPVSIGRYQVKGTLGRGAMGSIYKAHDPEIDRPVAIKLIRADLLESADRADFIARFRREAQAAGRCSHWNIVSIYDFALHEGNPFLAMEFVDGVTLSQARPASGRFAPADAIFLMLQVLSALQAAHAGGIVHRDIKPANIMLVGGRRVKVADFGIARMDTSNLTQRDSIIGTPSYMSPEQFRGETVDGRSDLFSAGVVLFEMLAGRKPFLGGSPTEVLARLLAEPAPNLRQLVPEVPAALAAVVARSLEKPPAQRHASADEMAAALRGAAATIGAVFDDRTVIEPLRPVVPDARPSLHGSATQFDARLLDTLGRKLAELVGPIAPMLVQSAMRRSATVEDLCAELESKVDRPSDRLVFQEEVRRQLGRSVGATAPGGGSQAGLTRTALVGLPAAELERAQAALARHMGPMARIMVKRAATGAPSAQALWETLAAQIDDAAARAAFLAER